MSALLDGQPAPSNSPVGAHENEAVAVPAAAVAATSGPVRRPISDLDNERQKAVNALLAAGRE